MVSEQARRELCLDPELERAEAKLLEAGSLRLVPRLEGEVRQGISAPQTKRLVQALRRRDGIAPCKRLLAILVQLLEPEEIQLARRNSERIAGPSGCDPVGAERAAQSVYAYLERVHSALRWIVRPQEVDRALPRDDRVRVQEQQDEKRPLHRPADRNRRAVPRHVQRPQQPKLERLFVHVATTVVSGS